jgi:RHS repeat-associated protein
LQQTRYSYDTYGRLSQRRYFTPVRTQTVSIASWPWPQYADITDYWVWFTASTAGGSANTCKIHFDTADGMLYLLNDAGTGWSGGYIGTPGTLQNSKCSVNLLNSLFNWDTYQLDLAITYAGANGTPGWTSVTHGGVQTGWNQQTAWNYYPSQSEQPSQNVSYFYDLAARGAVSSVRVGTVNDGISYYYTYNDAGRVVQQDMGMNNPPPGWPSYQRHRVAYNWDQLGRMYGEQYAPNSFPSSGINLANQFDNAGRLAGMTVNGQSVASAAYGPAGEMTSLWTSYAGTETRTYNDMLQLTRELLTTAPGSPPVTLKDVQYFYPAGANSGRISESKDWMRLDGNGNPEDVLYTYDSLQRLILAQTADTGPQWGNAYAYDGFGNLLMKTVTKGAAPMMSAAYDPPTNQPVSTHFDPQDPLNPLRYDANGNAPIGVWDVENHLVSQTLDGQALTWTYDAAGKRIRRYRVVNGQPEWTFWMYDVGGRQILQVRCANGSCATAGANIYFGGRLIAATDPSGRLLASTDRLGSVRAVNTNGTWSAPSFFPYGEEKTPVAADGVVKFATYTRDSTLSNQDYADQRYYSNLAGRFYSPDPSALNVDLANPASWNGYSYVGGDPVNGTDASGLFELQRGPTYIPKIYQSYCDLNPWAPQCHLYDGGGETGPRLMCTAAAMRLAYGGCPSGGGGGGGRAHNPCNDTADVAFVKSTSNLADAQTLAGKLAVPVQWVLAVAADESLYGTYPTAQAANNYFGIHSGPVAVANGSTGPYSGNPIFAAWAPGADGFLGSGNAMVAYAQNDGAGGATNASAFFSAIHAHFGVGKSLSDYVSEMTQVLDGVTSRMNCPDQKQ